MVTGVQTCALPISVVERDLVRKLRAEIGDTKFADDKIRKFPGARRDLFRERGLRRVLEKLRIKNFQHRAARAGADDDGLGLRELRQNFGGDGARLVPITGVERRLAAAGDLVGENNLVAKPFQNLDHADARARKQRVHEAGDEKRDGHAENLTANGAKHTKRNRGAKIRIKIYFETDAFSSTSSRR